MGFPKNYNRNMAINLKGDAAADDYKLIASGILSRTNSISESKSSYQYMDNRGTADTDVTGQEVSAAFTGHRKIGDAAQDYILDDVLYDLDKREVEFLDYDDSIAAGSPNGWKGKARLQITDNGSGNAADRQSISFALNYVGKPIRGTVTKDASGKLTFTPAS